MNPNGNIKWGLIASASLLSIGIQCSAFAQNADSYLIRPSFDENLKQDAFINSVKEEVVRSYSDTAGPETPMNKAPSSSSVKPGNGGVSSSAYRQAENQEFQPKGDDFADPKNRKKTDSQILKEVTAVLQMNSLLESTAIEVRVRNTVVYLGGSVIAGFQRNLAETGVLHTEGVTRVINQIKVRPDIQNQI